MRNLRIIITKDSFGNINPAGQGSLSLGVYPPPIVNYYGNDNPDVVRKHLHRQDDEVKTSGPTYYSAAPEYNILLVIVDQMRNLSFWLPAKDGSETGASLIQNALPNISGLAAQSFSFPNYWVAATICGPSRASLMTGLYAQQHCIFSAQGTPIGSNSNNLAPPLLPFNSSASWTSGDAAGFPTLGNVLSQTLAVYEGNSASYNCTYIGKWHLSCVTGMSDGNPGENGPADYGFPGLINKDYYSLPTTMQSRSPYYDGISRGFPSPNGLDNEGVGGDFIDSLVTASDVPSYSPTLGNGTAHNNWTRPGFLQLNDAAIADAFVSKWLPAASSNSVQPWLCVVSFVNPHDITSFPYAFGLTNSDPSNFSPPGVLTGSGFQPAPPRANATSYNGTNCEGPGGNCVTYGDMMYVANFYAPYANVPPGGGNSLPWNWEDLTLSSLQYANNGKPGLQYYYLQEKNNEFGSIGTPGAYNNANGVWPTPVPWQTFLNYYVWMQSCVDYQVGRVLGTGAGGSGVGLANSPFANNTVVIFTSDHGDYGGSHGLHAKGGGLYEEVMNVPLYVSYPQMRNNASATPGPYLIPYVCSSVDLLPFIYTLVLGNHSWRGNNADMLYHLSNRESINDAIYQWDQTYTQVLPQRRLSAIPLHVGNNGCSVGNNSCANWQIYQPFVLHTADDYIFAPLPFGGHANYQPSHAIAFRTVDITDQSNNSAPFKSKNTCGGGKLGIYNYWDTCGAAGPPIYPTNNSGTQYEFYNYSPNPYTGSLAANPQEALNQYFSNTPGSPTPQANMYLSDFKNSSSPGISVQGELYNLFTGNSSGSMPAQQVYAAIQIAFQNYITYLKCVGSSSGSDGTPESCGSVCADPYSS